MRLVSLIVLLALLGGAGYVWFFKREWLFERVQEGKNLVEGYTPAKTPSDAAEKFRKAIKDRNYQAAALYCSGEYGEQLTRCHDAAREIGQSLDKLRNIMEEKGLNTDNGKMMLYHLDPFPPGLKLKEVQKVETKGDKKGEVKEIAVFVQEDLIPPPKLEPGLSPMWFTTPLHFQIPRVEVKRVGSGDKAEWKLDIPLTPAHRTRITFFMDHHKSLSGGLETLRDDAKRGTYLKGTFEPRIKEVIKKCQ
jgi:hypothetical protein